MGIPKRVRKKCEEGADFVEDEDPSHDVDLKVYKRKGRKTKSYWKCSRVLEKSKKAIKISKRNE